MALISTWSRRKREAEKAASGTADVYQYTAPSAKLREQVRQLTAEVARRIASVAGKDVSRDVVEIMRKELGRPNLTGGWHSNTEDEFDAFLLSEQDVDNWLSAVEITWRLIHYYCDHYSRSPWATNYVAELNAWMLEDSFGYQIDGADIIQISNQFAHSEIVIPALQILSQSKFAGANTEFRQAHSEFRAGEYEDCIHDCCNAFESVLKVILDEKGWSYSPNDTAKKLLDVAFQNGLIPTHLQNSFTGLRTILESGVPTVRNRNGGHGAGANPRNIPPYLAAFQLHQTAAAVILLAEAAR